MDAYLFLVDLPPHADAGSDMIVTLPTTHVVLYGNRSTDDKKIISYRWTKITGGSVSMLVRKLVTTPFFLCGWECFLFSVV